MSQSAVKWLRRGKPARKISLSCRTDRLIGPRSEELWVVVFFLGFVVVVVVVLLACLFVCFGFAFAVLEL